MSELKRNLDFRIAAKARPAMAATPDIEESQPRQTLELQRVKLLWESGCDMGGGDPYNTIGTRAFRPRAA
jgi:hypothetical protein